MTLSFFAPFRTFIININDTESQPGQLSLNSDPLRAGRSGDQILVWTRFSAAVQTGLKTRADSCRYNRYQVTFPGVKRPGGGADHPPYL